MTAPWPNWPDHAPQAWDPADNDALVCRHVAQETHNVKTFTFSPAAPRAFRFLPGQFVTITFELDGQPISRCYTIASPPTRPDRIAITVKRVPGGAVSNWLHDNMATGISIQADGPFGAFTSFNKPAAKYLFLSGGSGITPLMSMLRTYADLGTVSDICFLHAARTPGDIIYADELAMLSRRHTGLAVIPICEAGDGLHAWHGYRGRLSAAKLLAAVPDILERQIYTCGPPDYMSAVRNMLQTIGFPMMNYCEESFVFEAPLDPTNIAPREAGFRIEFIASRREIYCAHDQTILDAALQAGLKLASSCTRGLCGTCKTQLKSGKVDMKHEGGIRQREIDRGQILICCSRPRSDLVLER